MVVKTNKKQKKQRIKTKVVKKKVKSSSKKCLKGSEIVDVTNGGEIYCKKLNKEEYSDEINMGLAQYANTLNASVQHLVDLKTQVTNLFSQLDEYDQASISCGLYIMLKEKEIKKETINEQCQKLRSEVSQILTILEKDLEMCDLPSAANIMSHSWPEIKMNLAKKGCIPIETFHKKMTHETTYVMQRFQLYINGTLKIAHEKGQKNTTLSYLWNVPSKVFNFLKRALHKFWHWIKNNWQYLAKMTFLITGPLIFLSLPSVGAIGASAYSLLQGVDGSGFSLASAVFCRFLKNVPLLGFLIHHMFSLGLRWYYDTKNTQTKKKSWQAILDKNKHLQEIDEFLRSKKLIQQGGKIIAQTKVVESILSSSLEYAREEIDWTKKEIQKELMDVGEIAETTVKVAKTTSLIAWIQFLHWIIKYVLDYLCGFFVKKVNNDKTLWDRLWSYAHEGKTSTIDKLQEQIQKQAEKEQGETWVLFNPDREDLPILKGWSEIIRRLGQGSDFLTSINDIFKNAALVTTMVQTFAYAYALWQSLHKIYKWGSTPKGTALVSLHPLLQSQVLSSPQKSIRMQTR